MSVVVLCAAAAAAGGLVGPGAVAPYSGGGGRQRGFGYVRDPAAGFFVTGSTVANMNGVYYRVDSLPEQQQHEWQLSYKHQSSGWAMGLVYGPKAGAPVQYTTVGGKGTEWLLVDEAQSDRFAHEGDTVIPGAGTKWKHVNRGGDDDASTAGTPDDEDELPWQVIYIGDASMVRNLMAHNQHHDSVIEKALLAAPPPVEGLEEASASLEQEPPSVLPLSAETTAAQAVAVAAAASGRFADCVAQYATVLGEVGAGGGWSAATTHLSKARCHRRSREFDLAAAHIDAALHLFPRFTQAMLERAQVLLERPGCADHDLAINALRLLLQTNRKFLGLDSWLVRAEANKVRAERVGAEAAQAAGAGNVLTAGEESARAAVALAVAQSNHYATLELSFDHSAVELRQGYRRLSRLHHPDKSGSNKAFQRVSAASETLGDPARRTAYDDGEDIPKEVDKRGEEGLSLKDQVLKRYFPERFQFHPFGDPFENKRAREQEKMRDAPPPPNDDGIPGGTYLSSCHGCAIAGGSLVCQQCLSSTGVRRLSTIALDACVEGEVIGNRDGSLACEPKPAAAGSVPGAGAPDEL